MKRLFQFPFRSRRAIATDVDAELAFHMEARTQAYVAAGMELEAARERALRDFGDVADARRYMNAVDREIEANRRRQDFMRDLAQDAVYALRQLRNAPAFTVTAILTLAVGIGANTSVLNLVNAVLFRPPPVHAPSRLAWVSPIDRDGRAGQWTAPDFIAFRNDARAWSGLVLIGGVDMALGGDNPARLSGQGVSANYFDVLGVRPSPGRAFTAFEDSAASGAMPIILSHKLWTERFGGDSAAVGRQLLLNQQLLTIVGIAPASYTGLRVGEDLDFWVPIATLPRLHHQYAGMFNAPKSRWLRVIGRLAPAAELEDARREAAVLQTRLEPHLTKPEDRRSIEVSLVRGGLDPGGQAKFLPMLALVMLVPLLVLGVAGANVANLFVSRSVLRQRELAVRRALGASRGRLVRQLLTECAILGAAAGLVGIVLSAGLTYAIGRTGQLPPEAMRLLVPDARVFVITLALALVAGAVFGLVPALAATRTSITPALKNDGISLQRGRHRLRDVFVVSQVAMSLSLLITAGLFVGSLQKALRVEPGFDPRNAIAVNFDLAGVGYDTSRARRFAEEFLERVRSSPGIEGATLANFLPLSGSAWTTTVRREDADPERDRMQSMHARVSNEYFGVMRIPIVRGRSFGVSERATSPYVVIVNERLAAMLWPNQEPLGKRMRVGGETALAEVVGVAANGKYRRLSETSQEPYFWLSAAQRPVGEYGVLVVRGATAADDAIVAARAALEGIDPALPPFAIERLSEAVGRTVEGQRAGAALLGVFGTLGLVLAAFGIFGVIAQGVASRTREIGIRMSLGAQPRDVVASFVREGLGLTLIGGAIGVLLSLAASRVLTSLLFGLGATDLLTFAGASAVLAAVATLASLLPARRAARVDPLVALRSD